MYEPTLHPHFEDLPRQEHAARLGMWVLLGSELLFFAALFALYAGYRVSYPDAFAEGVDHNARVLGTVNTCILIGGSTLVALAVAELRRGGGRSAALLTGVASLSGIVFLVLKSVEYARHFAEGIHPGGQGTFFLAPHPKGTPIFFTLYFAMTGLHAVHVAVGVVLLGWMALWLRRDRVGAGGAYRLENAALYWHFVDVVWIFLWPLFYLLGTSPK